MLWFHSKSKKRQKEILVPQIHFLGEQDGVSERELKTKLIDFFRRDQSVKKAYLARVSYGEKATINVTLCLQTQFGQDHGMVEKIARIFASMFGKHEHLDIIFLISEQESALIKTCKPFYVRPWGG